MAKVSFVVTRNGFVLHPDNDEDSAKPFTRLVEGTEYAIDVKKQRSGPFHRLLHKWLAVCFANQDQYDTKEQMRYSWTVRAGFVAHQIIRMISKVVTCPKCQHRHKVEIEEHILVPESLNYENMDQNQIEAVKNGLQEVAAEDNIFIPFDLKG